MLIDTSFLSCSLSLNLWAYWYFYPIYGFFCAQMGDQVRQTMSDTLVNYYGVNLEYYDNRMITDGWDKAQDRVRLIKYWTSIVKFYLSVLYMASLFQDNCLTCFDYYYYY